MKFLDLFKVGADGKPLWLGAVSSIEEARAKAQQQHSSEPDCDFRVFDQHTGKIVNIPRKERA